MDRYLILCAGEMRRWHNYRGVPKQLVEIDGVPLIDRTIRLLRERGGEDVIVVSATAGMQREGARVETVEPNVTGTVADKFLSSRHLWSGSGATHVLFGDVWFSEHAIQSLAVGPRGLRFLGRMTESRFTGCPHREIFAISFLPCDHAALDATLAEIREFGPERPGVASGWSLYDNSVERHSRRGGPGVDFLHVDDFTEDFDSPEDYDMWLASRADPAVPVRTKRERKRRHRLRRYIRYSALMGIGALVTLSVQFGLQ